MTIFEEIKLRNAYSIHHVIQQVKKYGQMKTLAEANREPSDAVIVGKIRLTYPLWGDQKFKHLLLKEVLKNGTYGKRFRLIVQGALAEAIELADVDVGDRMLIIKPNIVSQSIYKTDDNDLDDLEINFVEPYKENQRVVFIRKRCLTNDKMNVEENKAHHIEPEIRTMETGSKSIVNKQMQNTNKENSEVLTNPQKCINLSSCSKLDTNEASNSKDIDEPPDLIESNFTEGFSSNEFVANNLNNKHLVHCSTTPELNPKISNKRKYVYKKLTDITQPEKNVNVYFVVSNILKVIKGENLMKSMIVVKAVDETCLDLQHLVIKLMYLVSEKLETLIKPFSIVRVHRMLIERQNGVLEGRVFNGCDVIVVNNKKKSNAVTVAKSFTFLVEDEERIRILQKWLREEYVPSRICREVEWYSLSNVKPQQWFQIHCRVDGTIINSVSKTLVLNITDGTVCPYKVYQAHANESVFEIKAENCKENSRNVDVLVQNPCDSILKIKKGDFIILGPVKMNECGTDSFSSKYYCLRLQDAGHSVKLLEGIDPAIKKIQERLSNVSEHCVLQKDESKSPRNDGTKINNKRKLFNIEDNFEFNEKKRKNEECGVGETHNSTFEENNNLDKDVGNVNSLSSGLNMYNEQEQSFEIKKVFCENKLTNKEVDFNNSKHNEIFVKMKSKRIDQMSKESVEQCFMQLQSLLNKSVSKGSDDNERKSKLTEDCKNSETGDSKILNKSPTSSSDDVSTDDSRQNKNETNLLSNPTNESSIGSKVKTLVIKVVKLPPGQESGVIVKDDCIQLHQDCSGKVKGGDTISIMSLLKQNTAIKESETKNKTLTLDNHKDPKIHVHNMTENKANECDISDDESVITLDNPSINRNKCANVERCSVGSDGSDAVTVINETLQNKSVLSNSRNWKTQSLNNVESWLNDAAFNASKEDREFQQSGENNEEDVVHLMEGMSEVRGFLMNVRPSYEEEPFDLCSGFCFSKCKKLYLFSTLILSADNKLLCPECYLKDYISEVQLMFALQLTFMDREGYQLKCLLIREHAEEFFGCSAAKFINSEACRTQVMELLTYLKYNNDSKIIPLLNVCVTFENSQVVVWKTSIKNCEIMSNVN